MEVTLDNAPMKGLYIPCSLLQELAVVTTWLRCDHVLPKLFPSPQIESFRLNI